MNPMTNIKNVLKLSEQELRTGNKTSWHDQYRDSAWLFIGGLPYDLTEGDIICVFSQYGEIVTINLIRDKDTGKQKGFCFLCYEDQRSTDLAVDNLNGIKVLGRTIRVDHVSNYKVPKDSRDKAAAIKKIEEENEEVVDPKETAKRDLKIEPTETSAASNKVVVKTENEDIKLPQRLPIYPIKEETGKKVKKEKKKKDKKEKKKKSKKSKKRKDSSSDDDSTEESSQDESKQKKRKNSDEKRR